MKLSLSNYLDLRSIGVFRILLGLVLILDLLLYKMPYVSVFYSEGGVLNQETIQSIVQSDPNKSWYGFGLFSFMKTSRVVYLFFIFNLIFSILFTIGYRPKLFGFLSFILLFSIHQRNPLVVSGPDELLINLLLLSLFLPLDQRFSLFRSRKIKENKFKGIASFYGLFFIGLVYFFQAFLKDGSLWQNGNALSYALMEDLWIKPRAEWLGQNESLCYFISKSTLYMEYAIPLLIFFPKWNEYTRIIAAFLLLTFHWSIFLFLDLGLFPLLVPAYAFLILPSTFWNVFKKRNKWLKMTRKIKPVSLFNWHYIKHIKFAFIITFLLFITVKSFLHSEKINNLIAPPHYFESLNHTTLLKQNWGFYGPNPSITHGWYKIIGLRQDGSFVDLKTGNVPSFNNKDIREYQSYPWNVFYYRVVLYGTENSRLLIDNWSKYLYEELVKQGRNDIVQVQIHSFTQTITGVNEFDPIQHRVIGYAPL